MLTNQRPLSLLDLIYPPTKPRAQERVHSSVGARSLIIGFPSIIIHGKLSHIIHNMLQNRGACKSTPCRALSSCSCALRLLSVAKVEVQRAISEVVGAGRHPVG